MTAGFRRAMEKEERCELKLSDVRYGYLFVAGQDVQIHDLKITKVSESNTQLKLMSKFKNFDIAEERTFIFMRSGGQWLLDDIIQEEGSTRALVKRPCRL